MSNLNYGCIKNMISVSAMSVYTPNKHELPIQ